MNFQWSYRQKTRHFPPTVRQKWLKNENARSFNQNICTIGSKEACSQLSKYNYREKLVISKLSSTCPEEIFSQKTYFWKRLKKLTFLGIRTKFLAVVLQTDFQFPGIKEQFWGKSLKKRKYFFSDFEREIFD